MKLLAEIIGWIVLGSYGLGIIFFIGIIIWTQIETELFSWRMKRNKKKAHHDTESKNQVR